MGNLIPKIALQLSPDRYVVHVHTGDRKSAGTDANVYVQLRDTTGRVTAPRLLDHWFFNDLERGTTCSYPVPSDPELGEIDSLVLRRDDAGLGNAWFLDLVEVEDRTGKRRWTFPVHRWIHADTEYRLRQYDISLPQDDEADIRSRRQAELEGKRSVYQYIQRITEGPAQVRLDVRGGTALWRRSVPRRNDTGEV